MTTKVSSTKQSKLKKTKRLSKKAKQYIDDISTYVEEDIDEEPEDMEDDCESDTNNETKDEYSDDVDTIDDEDEESEEPEDKPSRKNKDKPSPYVTKDNYYVDTNRMEALIKEYNETGVIVDELAMCLYNIANRMTYMTKFINYTWKEEMVGDALLKELKALINKKYDPTKGRAFAYFSKIVYFAFKNRIKVEKKEHATIREYQESVYHQIGEDYQHLNTDKFEETT